LQIISSLKALLARRLFHPRTPIRSFVNLLDARLLEIIGPLQPGPLKITHLQPSASNRGIDQTAAIQAAADAAIQGSMKTVWFPPGECNLNTSECPVHDKMWLVAPPILV